MRGVNKCQSAFIMYSDVNIGSANTKWLNQFITGLLEEFSAKNAENLGSWNY